jgi:IrrE N-terminal-like domain
MEEIERRAEAVLAAVPDWIWNGEELPVPIEDIADSYFGLQVRDVEDLSQAPGAPELPEGQSLSGLLLASAGEIWVNADEARQWPPRRRFTIGHELGHWCLHRTTEDALFCRSATVQPDEARGSQVPRPPVEEEASLFAAAVLMPAKLITEHYESGCDFFALCDHFGVSGAAMGRRLHATIR